MTAAVPALEALKKEGESGRQKITQYTRYLHGADRRGQAYGISVGLGALKTTLGAAVIDPGLMFPFTCVTLTGGTCS